MPELDFDEEFLKFTTSTGDSAIKDVYRVLPSMSQVQMQILHTLKFYANRYGLADIDGFIELYLRDASNNKNLNMLGSMNLKSLLKAYTMDEFLHGINVSSKAGDER